MEITKYKISITDDVKFGSNVKVVEPVNIYGSKIGDDCFIGPFVEIQKNTTIGDRTKVQSHSFICELVDIGADCFIGHSVIFINDLFQSGRPSGGDYRKWKNTKIGNRVSIGSNATILAINVCDDVVIGAGSVVTKNIIEKGIYAGNPAVKLRNI